MIMGMKATLFNDAELFEQFDYTPSTEGPRPNVKSGEIDQAVSEKTFKDFEILCMYAQKQGQITPGYKSFVVSKRVCYFDHTLKVSASDL